MSKEISNLKITNLELIVKIGITDKERQKQQKLLVNIQYDFISLPTTCINDNINETICYDDVIAKIIAWSKYQECNTIERFTYCLHEMLHNITNIAIKNIKVTVIKRPDIKGFNGDCSFTIEDGMVTSFPNFK